MASTKCKHLSGWPYHQLKEWLFKLGLKMNIDFLCKLEAPQCTEIPITIVVFFFGQVKLGPQNLFVWTNHHHTTAYGTNHCFWPCNTYTNMLAASMVSEVSRICGRVGFVLGVTSYLGRAWWVLELHGVTAWVVFFGGACITCFFSLCCCCYCFEG